MSMKPFCCRCGEVDPKPIRDSEGDLIYWFRLDSSADGSEVLFEEAPSEDGERYVSLTGMTMKDFGYDGSFDVICPQCAKEECPYIVDSDEEGEEGEDGVLDEDGWFNEDHDPFDDDVYEDFLD